MTDACDRRSIRESWLQQQDRSVVCDLCRSRPGREPFSRAKVSQPSGYGKRMSRRNADTRVMAAEVERSVVYDQLASLRPEVGLLRASAQRKQRARGKAGLPRGGGKVDGACLPAPDPERPRVEWRLRGSAPGPERIECPAKTLLLRTESSGLRLGTRGKPIQSGRGNREEEPVRSSYHQVRIII